MEGISRRIGAHCENGTTEFCVWSPHAKRLRIESVLKGREQFDMQAEKFGYWTFKTDKLQAGDQYFYLVDDKKGRADPASRFQPQGVHGPSEIVEFGKPSFEDSNWENPDLTEYCIYELHTGTFTEEGTFGGIINKIPYLKELGINAIELLPLAAFPGNRNWGYDGVYPFAVQDSYGGPKGFLELVDNCHKQGMAVIVDVVYNHLGPEGNYLGEYGPYFSKRYKTPWGEAVNFDDAYSYGFRNFVVQNMLMWFRDYHVDALRLDAVHAIFDFSATHIMRELAREKALLSMQTGKDYYLIAESNLNDSRYINPFEKGGYGLDAQWSDDFHHAVHTLLTGEEKSYYMDFGKMEHLVGSYKNAYYYDGKYSAFRKKVFGNKPTENKAGQFVIFTQNHDQIGNRKFGERLSSLVGFEELKMVAALLVTSPYIPMLFMGEEYAEESPFLYFVSHTDPHLNQLVNEGRKKELGSLYGNDSREVPDPSHPDAFNFTKLKWNIKPSRNAAVLNLYRELFRLRKTHPVLKTRDKERLNVSSQGRVLSVYRYNEDSEVRSWFSFSKESVNIEFPGGEPANFEKILDTSDKKWEGKGGSGPEIIGAGENFTLKPGSAVIYSATSKMKGKL